MLSDRHSNAELAPIPSLLLTAAVHHHLVREKTRTQVGLIVEAGDVREVAPRRGAHRLWRCCGESLSGHRIGRGFGPTPGLYQRHPGEGGQQRHQGPRQGRAQGHEQDGRLDRRFLHGAQIFEALGLSREVVDRYFTGTTSKLGGVTLEQIAEEVRKRHLTAYPLDGIPLAHRTLSVGGEYQWRREGEPHLFDPETVFRLQHSTRSGRYDIFKQYTHHIDTQSERLDDAARAPEVQPPSARPIPIDEVEPVSEIVKRFSTGAMSYGSISKEAHETLAIAMNRLGGEVQHRERAVRTRTGSTTRSGAARSSRSHPAASV